MNNEATRYAVEHAAGVRIDPGSATLVLAFVAVALILLAALMMRE